jgi:hypothetical protein
MDLHARFEQLALSHVLGGIERGDADDFRTHLRACSDCRHRVTELRGISSSLDAAARDERRQVTQRSALERREPSPPAGAGRRGPSRLGVLVVSAALVVGFAFWNLHLRTSVDVYLAAADDRGAILRDLATGTLLDDPSLDPVSARVAVAGPRIALVIADGGPLGSDERLVAWLMPLGSSADEAVILAVGPASTTEVAVRIPRGAASRLVVTRERGLLSSGGPRGAELLSVPLPSVTPGT